MMMGVISLSIAFSYQCALSEAVKAEEQRYLSMVENQSGGRLHNKLGLIWTKGNSANISIATGPDD
jgi:hypothetical protein